MNTGVMQHQQQLWAVASSSLCKRTLLLPKEPAGSPHGAGCHCQAGRRGTPACPLTHPRALVRRRPEGPVRSRPRLRPPNGVRTSRGRRRAAETRSALSSGAPFPAPGPPATATTALPRPPARSLLTCARQGLAPPSRPLPQSSCCSGAPGSPRRQPPPRASSRYRCAMAARTRRHHRPAPPDVTAPPRAFPLRPKGTPGPAPWRRPRPQDGHAQPSDHAHTVTTGAPPSLWRAGFSESRNPSGR